MRVYDEYEEPDYRLKRVGKITLTTSDASDIARFRHAFFSGRPTYLTGWDGQAYVHEIRLNTPMDGINTADVVLQPTGAPLSAPVRMRKEFRINLSIGELKLDAEFVGRVTREMQRRVERVLETELTRAGYSMHRNITAYKFQEWRTFDAALTRAEAERLLASAQLPTHMIIDDPLAPPPSKSQQIQDWMTRRFIAGASKATGIPQGILTGTEPTQENLDLYARTRLRAKQLHAQSLIAPLTSKEKKKMTKVRNPYYVAAPSVTTTREQDQVNDPKQGVSLSVATHDRSGRWTRPTVNAAIEHAEELLRTDQTLEHVAIVKIVRVVRRKKTPVTVEVVK